jgi:hypothetical protein
MAIDAPDPSRIKQRKMVHCLHQIGRLGLPFVPLLSCFSTNQTDHGGEGPWTRALFLI